MSESHPQTLLARLIGWMTFLGKHERAFLISLVLVIGGVWGFAELADEVAEQETLTLDEWVLRALRNPEDLADPIGPRWFEETVRDFTALGSTGVLLIVTFTVFFYLILMRKNHAAVLLLLAVLGGLLLSTLLKEIMDRPRPSVVPHEMSTHTQSFPSGHSMMAAATFLTLGVMLAQTEPRLRMKAFYLIVALKLTVLVGLSRLYLGVHYPTDVLGGWTGGATWALLCWMVMERLQKAGRVESETG